MADVGDPARRIHRLGTRIAKCIARPGAECDDQAEGQIVGGVALGEGGALQAGCSEAIWSIHAADAEDPGVSGVAF